MGDVPQVQPRPTRRRLPPTRPIYLVTARKARGLTQEQLAVLAEVRQNYISRLESGVILNPGFETVKRLATELHVDPLRLMFGPDPAGTADDLAATEVQP